MQGDEAVTDAGSAVATVARLVALPRASLHPSDLAARSRILSESRVVIDHMARFRPTGTRCEHRLLVELWERENRRTTIALSQPISVLSALGALEDRWLRTHPGDDLPVDDELLVHLLPTDDFSPDDWAVRSAYHAFSIRTGWLVNSTSPVRFQLLRAPEWFVSFFPHVLDPRPLGSDHAPHVRVPLTGITDEEIETVLALWTPDVSSDLFDLRETLAAAHSLGALEDRDAARSR